MRLSKNRCRLQRRAPRAIVSCTSLQNSVCCLVEGPLCEVVEHSCRACASLPPPPSTTPCLAVQFTAWCLPWLTTPLVLRLRARRTLYSGPRGLASFPGLGFLCFCPRAADEAPPLHGLPEAASDPCMFACCRYLEPLVCDGVPVLQDGRQVHVQFTITAQGHIKAAAPEALP